MIKSWLGLTILWAAHSLVHAGEVCAGDCRPVLNAPLVNALDSDRDGITDDSDVDDDGDGVVDRDANSNGLIDIHTLREFNAIRYNEFGQGLQLSEEGHLDSSGCPRTAANNPGVCFGYELLADLDFDTNADGKVDSNDTYYTSGNSGWLPIRSLKAVLEGNGHVLRNWRGGGLFQTLDNAVIRHLGFAGKLTDILGPALASSASNSRIYGLLITGKVGAESALYEFGEFASGGGLIDAATRVQIANVFSTAQVRGRNSGGLVGKGDVEISMTYTVNAEGFGLVGYNPRGDNRSLVQSYWANNGKEMARRFPSAYRVSVEDLRCPILADDTQCRLEGSLFESWGTQNDVDGSAYWNFGDQEQMPGLVLKGTLYRDSDGDGYLDVDDSFPNEYAASLDTDRDGAADAWTPHCTDECKAASGLVLDQLPNSAAAAVDLDLDGRPERWSANCDQACRSASGLTLDTRPSDSDNDGVTNDKDSDDNGDGIVDVDADSDGLVDIRTLAELNLLRFSGDGFGIRRNYGASADTSGCPGRLVDGQWQALCQGAELLADINFDTNADGKIDAADPYGQFSLPWLPIGNFNYPFSAIFDGNGFSIKNLSMLKNLEGEGGLFGTCYGARIMNLALAGALTEIEGVYHVGALAGDIMDTSIQGVFASGKVISQRGSSAGLVGFATSSSIQNVSVQLNAGEGGGVSLVFGSGRDNSVVAALITGQVQRLATIDPSNRFAQTYWATDKIPAGHPGTPATLAQLKCPTAANNTSCLAGTTLYQNWDKEYDTKGNSYWHFGTATQLPGLVLNGRIYRDDNFDGTIDPSSSSSSNSSSSSASSSSSSSNSSSSSGKSISSSSSSTSSGGKPVAGSLDYLWLLALGVVLGMRRRIAC